MALSQFQTRYGKKRVEDTDESENSPIKMGRFQRMFRKSKKRKEINREGDDSEYRLPARKAVKLTGLPIIHEQAELGYEQTNCLILQNPSIFCFANVVVQTCFRIWRDRILSDTSGNPVLAELRNIIMAKGDRTVQELLRKMPGFYERGIDHNGVEHRRLKKFSDGNQHDAEEFWTALLNKLGNDYSNQFNVQECFEHVCQEREQKGKVCGNTTRTKLTGAAKYIEIHAKLRRGTTFEEDLRSDVIVNAANPRLEKGGGVCELIFNKAGSKEMESECKKRAEALRGGVLPPGGAIATLSGRLKDLKCIVHTAAPDMRVMGARRTTIKRPDAKTEQYLRMCYINACRCAADNGGTRIVFPILGIGIYGYNRRQGLAVAIQSIFTYFEAYPQTSIQSVALAIMDSRVYMEAKSLMKEITNVSFRSEEAKALRHKFEHDYENSSRRQDIQIPKTNVSVCSFVNN